MIDRMKITPLVVGVALFVVGDSAFNALAVLALKSSVKTCELQRDQTREQVGKERRELPANLKLLHIKDTPEIERKAEEGFATHLRQLPQRCAPWPFA